MKSLIAAALLASTIVSTAHADTADGAALIAMPWDQIVEQARGGTVNWFMWGGSDSINQSNWRIESIHIGSWSTRTR